LVILSLYEAKKRKTLNRAGRLQAGANANARGVVHMLMNVDETNGEIPESRSTRFPAGRRGAFSGGAARRIASYWAQEDFRLMFFAASLVSAAALSVPCALDGSTGAHATVHVETIQVEPPALVPGRSACIDVAVRSLVPITAGWSLHVAHDLLGDLEFEVCETDAPMRLPSRVGAKCPVAPGTNVSGRMCLAVPLAAMVHSGEATDLSISWADASGKPTACVRVAVSIAGEVAVDEQVEALAADVRQRLHRALADVTKRSSAAAPAASAAEAAGAATPGPNPTALRQAVRPLLLQVYDAQPDWAEAFARWQRAHRKKYHADEAEAAAFTAFRDNVLAAVRSGRPLALDERSDLSGETRRTLSHFA